MVKREVTVDEKFFKVEVDQCVIGSPFSARVNDKKFQVTLEREPSDGKNFSIKVGDKTYQVELGKIERNVVSSIKVNNIPFKFELKSPLTPKIQIVSPTAATVQVQRTTRSQGEGVVVAPMAGRIISIKVKKGDSVKTGDALCVLEAMKMENEIASLKNGVVEDIMVEEGKAVNEGDVLMLIK
jgi:biotin carboxyl carrier protein